MKKKRIGRLIFKLIIFGLIIIICYFIGESTYENIKKNEVIEAFKSRAYEVEEVSRYDTTYFYHKIARTYDYELNDQRNVFYDSAKMNPGVKGDVLLTFQAPFPYVPVIDQVLSFWLGGHAALVVENNRIIQSTGMTSNGLLDISTMANAIFHRGYDEENIYGVSAQKANNYWMIPYRTQSHAEYPYYGAYYRTEIMAVRTKYEDKNQIESDIDHVIDFAEDKVNRALYNYLFIFDTKDKYYCTDLVTRAFTSINEVKNRDYNLDDDGFIPSIHDMLLSEDTYLTLYKETKSDGIHVYYLEDII